LREYWHVHVKLAEHGINTGMCMQVHVRVQLGLRLRGPQTLAHCVASRQNVMEEIPIY